MPAFSIKHAHPEDIPAIISIQEETWEPTYGEILSKEQIDYMFDKIYSSDALKTQMQEGQTFLILLSENKPAGFAGVSEEKPGTFKLHKLYVLPSMQGTGAGKFLLNEAERYVVHSGGKVMLLNVNRYNKAKAFYEKQGYRVIEEKDIPIGPYWMNDYILERTLT
ncbi:GNAT family N-acetyltransferase [Dyadobacter crusticola]|uniref:GNAT family N-acetyltransferase n=1 Tax=Dyadobacter crusticola TaxID=292407 RepID=UPI0004E14599|nr:GNAT family N-acetyltransferase [Dyadobacter crusticola]